MTDAYDPDALNEQAETAPTDGEYSGEVIGIEETTAGEVYGEGAQSAADKPMIEVTVRAESGTEFEEAFSLPESDMSWRNPNFKLGRFRRYYGEVPRVGLSVEVEVDENGFLSVVLDD